MAKTIHVETAEQAFNVLMVNKLQRQCGECTLCCKLLPVPPLGKKANERCKHQRFKKGCAVYRTPGMPPECAIWNCRWLVNDDMADQARPDRSHLVVDIMPDFITIQDTETGKQYPVQVVQVWCDPNHRDAHRDPTFRKYVERCGKQGCVALIRYSASEAIILAPPSMSDDHQWHEVSGNSLGRTHTQTEIVEALSPPATMENTDNGR